MTWFVISGLVKSYIYCELFSFAIIDSPLHGVGSRQKVDRTRISRLFLGHRRELAEYVGRQLNDRDLAADFVQETFIRFMEHGDALPADSCRAFLYSTLRNLVIDHVRSVRRRKTSNTLIEDLAFTIDDRPHAEDVVAARQKIRQIAALLDELPQITQRIFVLNRVNGLNYRTVAKKLAVSESTVQKHLAIALRHLLSRLPR
ncbi:RNA polymerase sigma factor [Gluconobacter sphaericus]|uniref:RNA polymerase sigma factor n=1 Tax=Gluconobacter sphaericus TaxID=574987 RepID=UPI00142EC9A6|nr:RNA polymerase sigma factor [Gluconobacter sphaericus]MBF0886715.1 RNA polymerase sigma factor [Gluconobacter sphaericus]MBS1087303.1 RNA polymerase sigma factor [Gluconobacter sphaericus]MBS1101345.1 RNA polymerase sigma factor [Gluconobacter sphaericus]